MTSAPSIPMSSMALGWPASSTTGATRSTAPIAARRDPLLMSWYNACVDQRHPGGPTNYQSILYLVLTRSPATAAVLDQHHHRRADQPALADRGRDLGRRADTVRAPDAALGEDRQRRRPQILAQRGAGRDATLRLRVADRCRMPSSFRSTSAATKRGAGASRLRDRRARHRGLLRPLAAVFARWPPRSGAHRARQHAAHRHAAAGSTPPIRSADHGRAAKWLRVIIKAACVGRATVTSGGTRARTRVFAGKSVANSVRAAVAAWRARNGSWRSVAEHVGRGAYRAHRGAPGQTSAYNSWAARARGRSGAQGQRGQRRLASPTSAAARARSWAIPVCSGGGVCKAAQAGEEVACCCLHTHCRARTTTYNAWRTGERGDQLSQCPDAQRPTHYRGDAFLRVNDRPPFDPVRASFLHSCRRARLWQEGALPRKRLIAAAHVLVHAYDGARQIVRCDRPPG